MTASLRKAAEQEVPPLFAAVHGSFFPSDVRQGEKIHCALRKSGERAQISFEVWRISPFGIELVEQQGCALRPQQAVELTLNIGGQQAKYRGCVAQVGLSSRSDASAHRTAVKDRKVGPTLVGIRLDTMPPSQRVSSQVEQRATTRWPCHRLFYPTAVAKNTVRFNDKIHLRIVDLSLAGLRAATSLRNHHALVGLTLDCAMFLPGVGEVKFKAEVARVGVDKQDAEAAEFEQIIGMKFRAPSAQLLQMVGQYILQFGGDENSRPTPAALRKCGFGLYSVTEALEFDVVRTEKEYREVLALRSLAFTGVKELKVDSGPAQMGDVYDTRSRIVLCRFRGKVVGTVRLCFHGPNDKFEEESYTQLPANFPPRHLVVEASRAATHPDFRGTDLFLNLMRYTLLLTLQAGRRWIVQSTYDKLVPIYRRMGFRDTGVRCPHPVFPGKKLILMLGDVQHVMEGRLANPLIWCALFPAVLDLVDTNKHIRLGWVTRQRLKALRLMMPVYNMVERRHLRRRKAVEG